MAKLKTKSVDHKTLSILMEAKFEGDKCTAVHVQNPHLSWKRLGSMGVKLQKLADAIFHRENMQLDVNKIDAEIDFHMYGQTP